METLPATLPDTGWLTSFENILPVKYRWLIVAIVTLGPILGRTYHAISSGGGLEGIWKGLILGTNVPKDVPTASQPTSSATIQAVADETLVPDKTPPTTIPTQFDPKIP